MTGAGRPVDPPHAEAGCCEAEEHEPAFTRAAIARIALVGVAVVLVLTGALPTGWVTGSVAVAVTLVDAAPASAQYNNQMNHFLKNLSILGGLLSMATNTGGRPSLPWKARRAVGNAVEASVDTVARLIPTTN